MTTRLAAVNPVITYDGTQVAYSVPEDGRTTGWVVPTAGGAARPVCEECSLQGWFADNRRMLALDVPAPSRRVRVIDVVDRTATFSTRLR